MRKVPWICRDCGEWFKKLPRDKKCPYCGSSNISFTTEIVDKIETTGKRGSGEIKEVKSSLLLEEFESLQRGFWNLYNELLKVAPNHVCKKYLENEERLENEFREAYNKGDEERCKHIIKRMEQLCRGVANAIEKYGGYTPGTKPPLKLEKILLERTKHFVGYKCPYCDKFATTSMKKLMEHIATEHPERYKEFEDEKQIEELIKRSKGLGKRGWGWFVSKRPKAAEFHYTYLFIPLVTFVISYFVFHVILGNFWLFLGVVFFSIYYVLPKEHGPGAGKAALFFLSVIFIALGANAYHPYAWMLVAFAAYTVAAFRVPSEETMIHDLIMSIGRIGIGFAMALHPFFLLGLGDYLAWGLASIGIGFFGLAIPEYEEMGKSVKVRGVNINIYAHGKEHGDLFSALSAILVAFGSALVCFSLWSDGQINALIAFAAVAIISFFITFSVRGEMRGEAGFPLYLIMLFLLTTSYPDVLGQAVFGQWWPQVSAGIESVSKPLETGFSQLRQGMSDIWLMFTCPSCYYEKKIKEQQTKSKAEGSVLSLELVSFKPFSQYLDPAQNFGAMVTMQNKGESEIKELEIHVLDPQIKVSTGRKQEWKKISTTKEITSCTGSAEGETCEKDVVYPNEYVQFAFTLSNFGKIEGTEDTLDKCVCWERGSKISECESSKNCQCNTSKEGVYLTYKYGNYPVKLRFNYSFRYEATVSLQVMAMKKELYEKMLKEGKLAQKEVISKYSGGPVLLSIWTPMEPIVVENNGITVNFRIKNQGTGKVLKEKKGKRTKLTITLPEGARLIGDIKNIVKFYVGGCSSSEQEITCYLSKDLNPGEEAGFSFVATLPNFEGDTKTLTFTGNVTYIYGNEMEKKVFVISAPLS